MAPPAKVQGHGLGKKIGPLPLWGWLVAALVGYYLYKRYSASASSSSTTTGATGTVGAQPSVTVQLPAGGSVTGPAGSVPGLLNQLGYGGGAPAPGKGQVGTSPGSGAGTPGTLSSVFGSAAGAPVGTQQPGAAPYELGSVTEPGNAQYNLFGFPQGYSQQQIASALYPTLSYSAAQGNIQSTGIPGVVAVPNLPGEPTFPGVPSGAQVPSGGLLPYQGPVPTVSAPAGAVRGMARVA